MFAGEILDYIKTNIAGSESEVLDEDIEGARLVLRYQLKLPVVVYSSLPLSLSPSLFILGLRQFPELIAELERAIGEVKYGDYILAGLYVSTSWCGSLTMNLSPTGYSPEVDSLREKMKENEEQVNKLANSLRYKVWKWHVNAPPLTVKLFYFRNDFNVTRLNIVPHKSYIRVFEVTKGQTPNAERCPNLIK